MVDRPTSEGFFDTIPCERNDLSWLRGFFNFRSGGMKTMIQNKKQKQKPLEMRPMAKSDIECRKKKKKKNPIAP